MSETDIFPRPSIAQITCCEKLDRSFGISESQLLQYQDPILPKRGEKMSYSSDEAKWRRWRAVADLYHAVFTGLILSVVTRRGMPAATEFVFRIFRRQQLERFLPGLDKLGLRHLPTAVAAAQYHYLSN